MPLKAKYIEDFEIVEDQIVLKDSYKKKNNYKFKKITGRSIGGILEVNRYSSPVKEWLNITKIYQEEMDPTLAVVGKIVEDKLVDYLRNKVDYDLQVYDAKEIKYDAFKEESEILGGIPDVEPIDAFGNFLYDKDYPLFEIKTTSYDKLLYEEIDGSLRMQKDSNNIPIVKEEKQNYLKWFDENKQLKIPPAYIAQLQLYMYLRNARRGVILVAFLDKKDYAFPELFDPSKRIILTGEVILDLKKFKEKIDYCLGWYDHYVKKGISPKLTEADKWFLKKNLKLYI